MNLEKTFQLKKNRYNKIIFHDVVFNVNYTFYISIGRTVEFLGKKIHEFTT